jgi:hypothetical protein
MPVDERVWRRWLDRVEITNYHWFWRGPIWKNTGYGAFWYAGESIGAHVMACHLFYGTPIHRPRTEAVNHTCHVKRCVRPSHLLPGTQRQNILDAPWAQVTHCPKGHEYTEANTYIYRGTRNCRRCHAEREAARRGR